MPTQEERLETVEYNLKQFKTETIKAYGDMAFEMTIIGQDIKRIFQRLETMDESLNTLKQQLNQLETKFDQHTTLLTQILARLPKAP